MSLKIDFFKIRKLGIVIDSVSFGNALGRDRVNVRKLLSYFGSDLFLFLRSASDTKHSELVNIPSYNLARSKDGAPTSIQIPNWKSSLRFPYRWAQIRDSASRLSEKTQPSQEDIDRILLIQCQILLTESKDMDILVTDDPVLINHRIWFQSRSKLNITTVEEALETMDAFAKRRGVYHLASHVYTSSWLWYWYSFRSKVPFYSVKSIEEDASDILSSFAFRFVYLLMSLDEMATQYYSGANNDTLENTMYHFNYFVLLVCGIFDTLAIETYRRMKLRFRGEETPSRISLNKKSGDKFLQALKNCQKKGRELRAHIDQYQSLISMIFELREAIAHRELPPKGKMIYDHSVQRWDGIIIEIPNDSLVLKYLLNKGIKSRGYEPLTEWGLYTGFDDSTELHFLSPYTFAKATANELIAFSNSYLRILGSANFLQSLDPSDEFLQAITMMRQNGLGS